MANRKATGVIFLAVLLAGAVSSFAWACTKRGYQTATAVLKDGSRTSLLGSSQSHPIPREIYI